MLADTDTIAPSITIGVETLFRIRSSAWKHSVSTSMSFHSSTNSSPPSRARVSSAREQV